MALVQTGITARFPAAPGAYARSHATSFQFADIVRIAKARRNLILAVAGACVALTALALLLLPTLYSASAVLMLDQRKNNVADVSSVLTSLPTDASSVQNQIQILTSRDLASRVVDKLGLEGDPEFNRTGVFGSGDANAAATHQRVISAFLQHLSVEGEGLSSAITVSFSARSPDEAARIANAVADTYVDSQIDTKLTATHEATGWLEGRVRDLSLQVQAADSAVERYKAAHNLSESADGVPLIDQQISATSAQLVQAKADLAQKEATYSRVDALTKSGHEADISQAVASPLIIQLRSQEADLIKNEADLMTRYGPKHPKYIAAESQKHDLEQKIAQEVTRLSGSLSNDVSVARAQVGSLGSSLSQTERQAQGENFTRVKLKSLQTNAASVRSIYESFLDRLRTIQDQSAINASDAQIISHAAPPVSPSSPHRTLIFAASIPAALMLGLMVALTAEWFAAGTQVPSSPSLRGVPLLAEIPGVAHARAADLVTDWPMSPYAQAIAELAYRIAYGAARGGPRAVLITSPQAGEGATTVALSVARAAAKLGRRVVVVDANLAAPSVAPMAGHRGVRSGLREVLSGQTALSRSLIRDTRSNALILSPTQKQQDGHRILASLQLMRLVKHLRGSCDLLLICAPPVLSQNGTQSLARYADAVMLVARKDVAPRPAIAQAVDALARMPAPPIGIVLAS
jgi:succinoglycan biosynthesis transport protein ExoP